jgi:hypothetical protein
MLSVILLSVVEPYDSSAKVSSKQDFDYGWAIVPPLPKRPQI